MGKSVFVNSNALVPTRSYLPGGTFANDTVVFMPGVGYKDGRAVSIETGGNVAKTERERTDLARVSELTKISDKWVMGLPRRKDAPKKLINGWIPDREAREAAAPMGATQSPGE
jgi:lipoteichoic acid synthase